MSNETTDHAQRIAEIEARLEVATPDWQHKSSRMIQDARGLPVASFMTTGPDMGGKWISPADADANRELTVNAPADLRYLLTRVRECEGDREQQRRIGVRALQMANDACAERDAALAELARLGNLVESAFKEGLYTAAHATSTPRAEWHASNAYKSLRVVQQEGAGDAT